MKITRRNLNILIESYLNEINPSGILNKAAELGSIATPLLAREANIYATAILEDLLPYDAAKREAQTKDADKYFHYLAFMNAVANMTIGDEEIRAKFDTIGNAKEFLDEEEKEIANKVQELGIEEDLANHKGLTLGMLLTLGEENIKTLKDFAELSTDEIIGGYDEIKGKREKFDGILEEFDIPRKDAEDLIMRARKKVFNF